ncbi:MAG: septum formation initiator [Ruminococcaceae bacterium]|nr:septum formation initiator [Oscillospiraceae bacterium]
MHEEIRQKEAELELISQQLNDINVQNEQLRHYSSNENRMEYIEQIARDQLDYSHSDETVYYFVPK